MNSIGPTLITVLGGIFTLAMLAVVVSKNANTSAVFTGAGTALTQVIGAAVGPVSGTSTGFGSTGSNTAGTVAG